MKLCVPATAGRGICPERHYSDCVLCGTWQAVDSRRIGTVYFHTPEEPILYPTVLGAIHLYTAEEPILYPSVLAAVSTIGSDATCFLNVHLNSVEPATRSASCELSKDAESSLASSAATAADILSSTEQDHGDLDSLVPSSIADAVDSMVLDLTDDAVLHYDVATAFAVDAVVDELVGQAVYDAETAHRDMLHTGEAERAVDIVVDELISNTVADLEVAQAQPAGALFVHLASKAVADGMAAQPLTTTEPAHQGIIHAREAARAVDSVLDELVNSTVAGVEAAQAQEAGAVLGHLDSKAVLDAAAAQPVAMEAGGQWQLSNAPKPGPAPFTAFDALLHLAQACPICYCVWPA